MIEYPQKTEVYLIFILLKSFSLHILVLFHIDLS